MNPVSVLLVDDDDAFTYFATRFLQKCCADEVVVVGTAENGEEALSEARRLLPDVILLDMRMPGLTGTEVIPLLREALSGVGIIATSLLETTPYRRAALAAGADDFICKDRIDTDLLLTIQRVALQRASMNP